MLAAFRDAWVHRCWRVYVGALPARNPLTYSAPQCLFNVPRRHTGLLLLLCCTLIWFMCYSYIPVGYLYTLQCSLAQRHTCTSVTCTCRCHHVSGATISTFVLTSPRLYNRTLANTRARQWTQLASNSTKGQEFHPLQFVYSHNEELYRFQR